MWMGVADPPSWYHSCGPRGAIAEELGSVSIFHEEVWLK